MSEQKTFRCAVYTRKSSEEGLEQDFNSLEAQREACEAYIRSQAHEGWKLILDRFDDGGFSGGNMERPALGRLMSQIQESKVDIIVIYKIDRLTRSLTDFARLAETFDKHRVSFVSVTQQFNTTTSMGRLMLNVLLSFAQFEREITGERIRDKIAASKKKGMWMGGPVPMGYDVKDRQLVVNETDAEIIRRVFRLYLEEGSVPELLERLTRERLRTATRVSAKGRKSGGMSFTRGHVYKLLSNPIYIGRVPHKGTSHPGQHPPIIDRKIWDAVQSRLVGNTQGERKRRRRAADLSASLLADILYSEAGNRMIPMHANRRARRYSYYVEQIGEAGSPPSVPIGLFGLAGTGTVDGVLLTHSSAPFTGANRQVVLRLPAAEIDAVVVAALKDLLSNHQRLLGVLGEIGQHEIATALTNARVLTEAWDETEPTDIRALVSAVSVSRHRARLAIDVTGLRRMLELGDGRDLEPLPNPMIEVPVTFRQRGVQLKLAIEGRDEPVAAAIDATLVTAIARGFDWFERLSTGQAKSIDDLAKTDGFDPAYVSHVLPLAFLSPAGVEEMLVGRQNAALTADRLIWHEDVPRRWANSLTQ